MKKLIVLWAFLSTGCVMAGYQPEQRCGTVGILVETISIENDGSDPFKSLGIPDLNPQRMLEDLELQKNQNVRTNEVIKLKSIADVPKFLKF